MIGEAEEKQNVVPSRNYYQIIAQYSAFVGG